jgi:hypothetical protein
MFAILALVCLPLGCRRVDSSAAQLETVALPPWFEDVTERVGLNFVHDAGPVGDYFMPQQVGSGAALFDFDRDGRLDTYLLQSARGTGFGTTLADFDQDGALDLAVVNGRVSALAKVEDMSLGPFWSSYGDRNKIFRGDGRGHFENLSPHNKAFCGRLNVARGLVRGDIDGDGAVDLLVTTIGGPARLFKNIAPDRGHWLQVCAFDSIHRRDALGALVRVRTGGKTRVCSLHPADGYLCSSEPRAHFGLGATGHVDAIEIVWPDGRHEIFDNESKGYAVDQSLEFQRYDRSGGGN